jgi:hypothetical protein
MTSISIAVIRNIITSILFCRSVAFSVPRRLKKGRAMKESPYQTTREALGCFVMLILGALMMMLGLILLVVPNGIMALVRGNVADWWRLVLIWVVTPTIGIVLVAGFTYGFNGIAGPKEAGMAPAFRFRKEHRDG